MMIKSLFIFCLLIIFGCSSQKEISSKKAKSFNTKSLIGFYEEGCTEFANNKGEKEIVCPIMDLGDKDSNPKYEIQMLDKTKGYYILHHGIYYDRPAIRDTSQLTIIKENHEIIMQIVSKRDTVFEVIDQLTSDTLFTHNARHEVRYFYPRIKTN